MRNAVYLPLLLSALIGLVGPGALRRLAPGTAVVAGTLSTLLTAIASAAARVALLVAAV